MKEFKFELFPNHSLHLFLFNEVKNSNELLKKLQKFELELAMMNAEVIPDIFPVLVAANKSLYGFETKNMTTKNIHSELVFNISGGKHITSAIKKFGITSKSNMILVGIFDATKEKLEEIPKLIKGELVDSNALNDQLSKTFNKTQAKKVYKITEEEFATKGIVASIVIRIAVRES